MAARLLYAIFPRRAVCLRSRAATNDGSWDGRPEKSDVSFFGSRMNGEGTLSGTIIELQIELLLIPANEALFA
jgi:hypothetical protein